MGKTNKKNSDDHTDKKWLKRQQKRLRATRNKKEKEPELEEDEWDKYAYVYDEEDVFELLGD